MFKKNKKEIDLLNKLEKNVLNPVTYIQGYSSIIKNNKNLPSELLEKINKIDTASNRILTTIQSYLMIYDLESKKNKVKLESVKLLSAVHTILDKYIRLAKSKRINFYFEGQNTNEVISNKKYLSQAMVVLMEEIFLILEKGNISVLVKKEGTDMLVCVKVVFANDNKIKLSDTPGYELANILLSNSKNKISFSKNNETQNITLRFSISD